MIKPYKATGLITHCYVCNTDLTYDDSDIVKISTQYPYQDMLIESASRYIVCPICKNMILINNTKSGYSTRNNQRVFIKNSNMTVKMKISNNKYGH